MAAAFDRQSCGDRAGARILAVGNMLHGPELIHPSPFIITTASHTFHQEKKPTQNNRKQQNKTLRSHINIKESKQTNSQTLKYTI